MTLDQQQAAPTADAPKDRHIMTGSLFRRRSSRVTLTEEPPPPKPEAVCSPAKVARMLALAHHLQSAIDRGLVADRAAVARKLWLTRPGSRSYTTCSCWRRTSSRRSLHLKLSTVPSP